ncbi:hypothetical protein SMIR_39595 [Streptomyces mirabilis]|nr:hypothetical protein HEP84_05475 [Streptomyces sp. RLB1-33]QUW84465.1 hypothetical protein SMIR_39595 [Streptomyces mirabilis]
MWGTDDGVRLQARSGRDVTAAWGDLALAGHHLPAGTVLDGEAVITTEDGRISFEAAQARAASSPIRARRLAAQRPAHYIAFDALQLPSGDARPRPYSKRRAALLKLLAQLPANTPIQAVSATTDRDTALTWYNTLHTGVEGIVAKRTTSLHRARPHRGVVEDPPRGHDRSDRGRVHRHRTPAAGTRRTASQRTRRAVPAPDHGPGHPDRPASGPPVRARVHAGRQRLHTRKRSGRCGGPGRHHPACGGHRGPPTLTRPQASARLRLGGCHVCLPQQVSRERPAARGPADAPLPAGRPDPPRRRTVSPPLPSSPTCVCEVGAGGC